MALERSNTFNQKLSYQGCDVNALQFRNSDKSKGKQNVTTNRSTEKVTLIPGSFMVPCAQTSFYLVEISRAKPTLPQKASSTGAFYGGELARVTRGKTVALYNALHIVQSIEERMYVAARETYLQRIKK